MYCADIFSAVGLILDIAERGLAVHIWLIGTGQRDRWVPLSYGVVVRATKRQKGNIGTTSEWLVLRLGCLMVGFVLQLVSNFLS